MSGTGGFAVQAYYEVNPSRASRQVTVLIRVTATSADSSVADGAKGHIAETIVLDRSGSMNHPRTKLRAARDAACAAVDTLPDGAMFAILAGTYQARMVYPREPILAPMSDRIRADAKEAVLALEPSDEGTVIGSWLDRSRELLEPYDGLIRHATLLTDGRNQHQHRADLDRAIDACRGVLSCDARGIGEDWDGEELLHIVEALHGTAPELAAIDDLTTDFTHVMRGLMSRAVPEVTLRVRCGKGVTLAGVEQAYPLLMDMKQHVIAERGNLVDYALGPWADETREYVLRFDADPDAPAASDAGNRIGVIELRKGPDGTPIPDTQTFVDVRWIDMGQRRKTELETQYELRRELALLIKSACKAWLAGRHAAARREWLAARTLAERLSDAEALARLRLVLDGKVTRELVNQILLGSSRTGLTELPRAEVTPKPPETAKARQCPKCGRIAPPGARFCERGDYEFPGDDTKSV